MKMEIHTMFMGAVFAAACCLSAYSGEPQTPNTQEGAQAQMGPEMMQQMKDRMGDNPMMSQCMIMMWTPIYPGSPCGLFAMADDLKLSGEQMAQLKSIAEKSNAEAMKILTEEQLKAFQSQTKEWKPMSMMQGMQKMMPQMQKMMGSDCSCPMCSQMKKGEKKSK